MLLFNYQTIRKGIEMKKVIVVYLSLLFLIFGFNNLTTHAKNDDGEIKFSSSENENKDTLEYKGAIKYVAEITKIIENTYGSHSKFEKVGGIRFDSEGILYLYFKQLDDNLNVEVIQSIIDLIGNSDLLKVENIEYSTHDLISIEDEITRKIKEFYSEEEFNKLAFMISADVSKQNVVLEHNGLDQDLINLLLDEYPDVFDSNITKANFETTKSRLDNWNQLGGGLALDYSNCTLGAMSSKSGVYFALTAGHCFSGSVSPTGGDLVRQNNVNVGRQHAEGSGWLLLDVGLIRITDNALNYGRYATNKIKRWDSTDIFDGRFTGATQIYNGVPVCKTGITTITTCGTVTNADTTVKYKNYPTTYKVAFVSGTDFAKPGDSGGPVFFVLNSYDLRLSALVSGNLTVNGVITGGFVTKWFDFAPEYGINLYTSDTNYLITN